MNNFIENNEGQFANGLVGLRHQIAVLERSRTRRPCFRR
jgi:hypothetical protein